jgi:hypothetical protein
MGIPLAKMGSPCRCHRARPRGLLRTVGSGRPEAGGFELGRYIVERTFPDALHIPVDHEGAEIVAGVVWRNQQAGVTWVQSYVSEDKTRTFCVYDAPDPESIRRAALDNGIPVDAITRVTVLSPYFYS